MENGSVQLDDIGTSRSLMQPIDILGDDTTLLARVKTPMSQRQVSSMRLYLSDELTTPPIPGPHHLRGILESCRSRKFFWSVSLPETSLTTKGRDPALGTHSGSGEDHQGSSGFDDRGRTANLDLGYRVP
jgi:hypothetical protein